MKRIETTPRPKPDSPAVARGKAQRAAARLTKAERGSDAVTRTRSPMKSGNEESEREAEGTATRSAAATPEAAATKAAATGGPTGRKILGNPLLSLPEEQRSKLFTWLRECPYDDAVQHLLRDQGLPDVTKAQLNDFFQAEAEDHWEKRISRAAVEANALVQLVEKSPVRFSAGILAALGQEAFRQIASGQVEPQAMGRIATLFLRARSDERADQMQELKREKVRHELTGQVDYALEKLVEEVDRNPLAREAFEALRRELAAHPSEEEEI